MWGMLFERYGQKNGCHHDNQSLLTLNLIAMKNTVTKCYDCYKFNLQTNEIETSECPLQTYFNKYIGSLKYYCVNFFKFFLFPLPSLLAKL